MRSFLTLLCVFVLGILTAQEEMVVERCSALDREVPIKNIYVGPGNQKWVSNDEGLFVVHAADLATPVDLKEGEMSILQIPDGNKDLRVERTLLESELGGILSTGDEITAAFYNHEMDELWIGTRNNGLFLFWLEPKFKMVKRFNTRNTRMRSDHVNTIFIDKVGRHWIGTEDGVLVGKNLRWGLEEKYFRFQAITSNGQDVWLLSEDLIWVVDEDDNWNRLDLPAELTEGNIEDIAFDKDGRLWIASEQLTMYDVASGSYKTFDGADYFTSSFVNCIAVDDEGAVWVGTDDKGLYLIEKASALTVTCLLEKPLSCEGDLVNDAILAVHINGGQAPYRYAWDDGGQGANRTGLSAGTYIVTVTDSNGKSKMARGVVPNPRLTLTVEQTRQESPEGNSDAAASVKVEGGVPEYSFQWDNGERRADAERLSAGEHRVTVTDANGCSATAEIDIVREIADLVAKLNVTKQVDCFGTSGGELEVQVSGGQGPYTFNWSNSQISGSEASALKAGEYRVTVSDALGMRATSYVELTEPDELIISVRDIIPATTEEENGAATASARGGVEPYEFSWSSGVNGPNVQGLGAGNYSVMVADANGCASSTEFEVPENVLPLSVRINEQTSNQCFGDKKASLEIIIEGGKKPFEFTWSNPRIRGGHASGLAAGNYSLTVTDAAGNAGSASIVLEEPAELIAEVRVDAPASTDNQDGKASLLVRGGKSPYTYTWDNGENGEQANSLAPGDHQVTATDAAGCEQSVQFEIRENILALQVSPEVLQELRCHGDNNGALNLLISGGKAPYQFKWSDDKLSGQQVENLSAGRYDVTVSDAVGNEQVVSINLIQPPMLEVSARVEAPASTDQNDGEALAIVQGGTGDYRFQWDNGESAARASRLDPGIHKVTVTDEAGCEQSVQFEIRENILALQASLEISKELQCHGDSNGALNLSVSGGKAPYQFKWFDEQMSGQQVENLSAGKYDVTVSDAVGNEQVVSINLTQPPVLEVSARVEAPASTDQSDGESLAIVQGGTGDYRYQWDNGESSPRAERLGPGTHRVTVTDEAGCQAEATVEIRENILDLVVNVKQTAEIPCNGDATAAGKVEVIGGKGPYEFDWGNTELQGEEVTNLKAGVYQVTVRDVAGNVASSEFRVTQPPTLSAEVIDLRPATDESTNNGKAKIKVSGGTGQYTYTWDHGATSLEVDDLSVGSHTVTVTDEAGCTASAEFEIEKKILPALTAGRLRHGQVVKMEQLQFDADSATITESSIPVLEELYTFLSDNPEIVVQVEGHTNGIPPHEFCDSLSTERARNVALFLTRKGIAGRRVYYKGYGKRQPIASNDTVEGRRRNQRVEIRILELRG